MTTRILATAALSAPMGAVERARVCAALGRLRGAVQEIVESHAGLHLDGSLGAGDLVWDLAISDADALETLGQRLERDGWSGLFANGESAEDRARLRTLTQIEAWRIELVSAHVPRADLAGIKRTNLVRVMGSASPESVERWSREVVALAQHVPAIRNWSLARIHAFGPSTPRVRWTHAWEQEFETLEGLLHDYMASPYHWGWLDGWYDPEVPFHIVEADLAHLYCEASQNVLGWNYAEFHRRGDRIGRAGG